MVPTKQNQIVLYSICCYGVTCKVMPRFKPHFGLVFPISCPVWGLSAKWVKLGMKTPMLNLQSSVLLTWLLKLPNKYYLHQVSSSYKEGDNEVEFSINAIYLFIYIYIQQCKLMFNFKLLGKKLNLWGF